VSADTLEVLAQSPDDYVLGDVAANPKLSEATLRALAKKGGYLIEWGLAANPKTPPDVLAQLAQSENRTTRDFLTQNKSARALDGGH
jgi:hypothetical protein